MHGHAATAMTNGHRLVPVSVSLVHPPVLHGSRHEAGFKGPPCPAALPAKGAPSPAAAPACRFIELCAKYLTLHVRVLQGQELVPTISQRGEGPAGPHCLCPS